MEEPGAERSSSPSGSEDSEGESKHGDVMENGRESEEEHSKGEIEDSSSDSDGSGEDDSEHSAKSDQEDARDSGGGGGEESQGEEYGDGGGGGSSSYPVEGEAYPMADLPLEVITTVEPTNYAYPVLKNMSNGVLTHRNIFTEVERSVLVGIINKYRNIVDTRSRTREIYLEKQNVWQQIVEEYNSTDNIMVRTEKELRKCWDNMKYRAKQAEKEMFKVEVKAEGEAEVDIKMEPPDHDAFHFAPEYDAAVEDAWQCADPGGEEEREPALKKARQESPKLSSLLLAAAHKRPPAKKTSKGSSNSTPYKNSSNSSNSSNNNNSSSSNNHSINNSSNINNNSNSFQYSIPSCTKVMHVKKKGHSGTATTGFVGAPSQEIPILPKGLASCLSITNIPNPAGAQGTPSRESVSPSTSPVQVALKPMPSLKKMVPSKHQHGTTKGSSMRSGRKSNGLSSKSSRGHRTPVYPVQQEPLSLVPTEGMGEEQQLSIRLVTQRHRLEQREHEMRMRVLEKELQAHTFQCQYWSLRLKLLRAGRESGSSGSGGPLNLAGATNGDID